ncbi:hypothetical protein VCHA53O469_200051 [Vibrio chagasii]|nr:hypothetical protein VCHA53O469_200051 [Vibrio chagasii]
MFISDALGKVIGESKERLGLTGWLCVTKLTKNIKLKKRERVTRSYQVDKERYSMISLILLQFLRGVCGRDCERDL